MPISRVRRLTAKATTPYSPTAPPYDTDLDSNDEEVEPQEEEITYCITPDPSVDEGGVGKLHPSDDEMEQMRSRAALADKVHDIAKTLNPLGGALQFAIFAGLCQTAEDEANLKKLVQRDNMPADLEALGQAFDNRTGADLLSNGAEEDRAARYTAYWDKIKVTKRA